MKKLLAYAAASVVAQQIGGYLYYITESAIKDRLYENRLAAKAEGWSEGWDSGWCSAHISLIPYINDEHWQHMYGMSFSEFLDTIKK